VTAVVIVWDGRFIFTGLLASLIILPLIRALWKDSRRGSVTRISIDGDGDMRRSHLHLRGDDAA
jgi:hypothetical protein